MVWPHGEKAFYGFLDSLNNHEPPIRFKATLNKQKLDFMDTTIFKDAENENGLLTRSSLNRQTLINCCIRIPFT